MKINIYLYEPLDADHGKCIYSYESVVLPELNHIIKIDNRSYRVSSIKHHITESKYTVDLLVSNRLHI